MATYGYTGTGTNTHPYVDKYDAVIIKIIPTSDMVIQNIRFYSKINWTGPDSEGWKGKIWDASGNPIHTTTEHTSFDYYNFTWGTGTFSTPPTLTNGTTYYYGIFNTGATQLSARMILNAATSDIQNLASESSQISLPISYTPNYSLYMNYTGTAAGPTNVASVGGVTAANIGSINSVSYANVAKINTVD